MNKIAMVALTLAMLACGGKKTGGDPNDPNDPNANGGAVSKSHAEVVSGAAQMTGGTLTMDAVVGHPVTQAKSAGDSKNLGSASATTR